jgi:hypothetical protein
MRKNNRVYLDVTAVVVRLRGIITFRLRGIIIIHSLSVKRGIYP